MNLVKFRPMPFESLVSQLARTAMNDLKNASEIDAPSFGAPANIVETAEGYQIQLAAPGFSKEDVAIGLEDGILTITGKKEAQNEETAPKWHRREFAVSSFSRSFRLPKTVETDNIKARFEHGVLNVDLSKKAEAKPVSKNIEIA